LPELPDKKKLRFETDYGLSSYDAQVLTADINNANFFEEVVKGKNAKFVANWIITNLFGMLNDLGKSIQAFPINSKQLSELLDLIQNGTISGRIAKEVFEEMVSKGGDASKIVESKGLKQISNADELEKMVKTIIDKNAEQVDKYKKGNEKLLGWFVGQVMKKTQGKANPQIVNEVILRLLKE